MNTFKKLCLTMSLMLTFSASAYAQDSTSWEQWLNTLKTELIEDKGLDSALVYQNLDTLSFDPDVIKKDNAQPSARMSFATYKEKAVNQVRIKQGKRFYQQHRSEIDQFAKQYGVSPYVMVALLGIESNYGGYTGNHDVIRSMATLAYGTVRDDKPYQERRKKMFRDELYYALKIIDDGILTRENFKGSWAGASGINQHMPSSYYAKVVDGDEDGDRDIWSNNDLSDVFATTANHLKEVGWKTGQRWGREVKLPEDFSTRWAGNKIKKPLLEWRRLGVTQQNGQPLPVVEDMQGSIIIPDGLDGQAYIGYDNFHAFRRWNRSDYFALVVGSLADAIASP